MTTRQHTALMVTSALAALGVALGIAVDALGRVS